MKLLWINPIATNVYDEPIRIYLESVKEPGTEINVVSFPPPGPTHLEYNCYEMWMMPRPSCSEPCAGRSNRVTTRP